MRQVAPEARRIALAASQSPSKTSTIQPALINPLPHNPVEQDEVTTCTVTIKGHWRGNHLAESDFVINYVQRTLDRPFGPVALEIRNLTLPSMTEVAAIQADLALAVGTTMTRMDIHSD